MFHKNAGRIILNNYYLVAEIPDAEGAMTCSAIDLNDYVTGRDGKSSTYTTTPLPYIFRPSKAEAKTENMQEN